SLVPYVCACAYARTRAACALCPACDISPADEERHLCPDAWRREIQSYSPISSKRWKISASNFWTGLGRGEFGQGRPGQAGARRAERGGPSGAGRGRCRPGRGASRPSAARPAWGIPVTLVVSRSQPQLAEDRQPGAHGVAGVISAAGGERLRGEVLGLLETDGVQYAGDRRQGTWGHR